MRSADILAMYGDDDISSGSQSNRRGGRKKGRKGNKKKQQKASDDADEEKKTYSTDNGFFPLKPKDMQYLQRKCQISGGAYRTLTTLLEPNVAGMRKSKDGIFGETIYMVLKEFDEAFVSFGLDGNAATLYIDNCLGNRTSFDYAKILAQNNYSCSIEKGTNGNSRVMAISTPAHTERLEDGSSKEVAASVDVFLHKFSDAPETEQLIRTYKEIGYIVNLHVGGVEPLAQIQPGEQCVEVCHSKGERYDAAQSCMCMLMDMGYGVEQRRAV